MDFTREPIIETVITPKEGCKLVVRSSKSTGQEEYFVDSVEVVSFGNSFFFRSMERPKSFLVPVSDYEILEVREARMVLKNVGMDRAIKIAGGREGNVRGGRESHHERVEAPRVAVEEEVAAGAPTEGKADAEGRTDKKRDRRRQSRRRRGRDEPKEGEEETSETPEREAKAPSPRSRENGETAGEQPSAPPVVSALLPPPTTLISETIARYKDNDLFKGAFFLREEQEVSPSAESVNASDGSQPQDEFGSFEASDEEAEEIYRLRATQGNVAPGAHTLSSESPQEVQAEQHVETSQEILEGEADHSDKGNS